MNTGLLFKYDGVFESLSSLTGPGAGNSKTIRTSRAGVRVPSTSNKHIVFLTGLSCREGMTAVATAILVDDGVSLKQGFEPDWKDNSITVGRKRK